MGAVPVDRQGRPVAPQRGLHFSGLTGLLSGQGPGCSQRIGRSTSVSDRHVGRGFLRKLLMAESDLRRSKIPPPGGANWLVGEKMKGRMFTVRLARPLIEVADVEVEATSADEARSIALRHAAGDGTVVWQSYDGADFEGCTDVVAVVDHREIEDSNKDRHSMAESNPAADNLEPASVAEALGDRLLDRRWALLAADVNGGEGSVVAPSWLLGSINELMMADLTSDWIDALTDLNAKASGGYASELELLAERVARKRKRKQQDDDRG